MPLSKLDSNYGGRKCETVSNALSQAQKRIHSVTQSARTLALPVRAWAACAQQSLVLGNSWFLSQQHYSTWFLFPSKPCFQANLDVSQTHVSTARNKNLSLCRGEGSWRYFGVTGRDLAGHRKLQTQVFPAKPQPRPSTPSVPCHTSTKTIHAQCSLPDRASTTTMHVQ